MKRFITLLTLVALTFSLTACGYESPIKIYERDGENADYYKGKQTVSYSPEDASGTWFTGKITIGNKAMTFPVSYEDLTKSDLSYNSDDLTEDVSGNCFIGDTDETKIYTAVFVDGECNCISVANPGAGFGDVKVGDKYNKVIKTLGIPNNCACNSSESYSISYFCINGYVYTLLFNSDDVVTYAVLNHATEEENEEEE